MKKISAILLVLVLCISALSVCAFATGTITIRVSLDTDTAPNAWAWGPNGDVFPTWPGEPMVKNGEWWEISVPTGTTGFIVNNGTAQTGDITLAGDADVEIEVSADFSTFTILSGGGTGGGTGDAPTKEDAYYVAGVGTLCGAEWTPDDANNKMTEGADGIFTMVYKNVAAGEYQLKVTNGTWDKNWGGDGPDGNYLLTVTEASDVTVKFDYTTGTISVEFGTAEEPEKPDTETPDTETPDTETPDTETPDTETPDTETPDGGTTGATPSEGMVFVHAYVPENTSPYFWAWEIASQKNAFEAWPGNPMNSDGDWYTIEVPNWCDGMIVNDGSANQTQDIQVEKGKEVWIVVNPHDWSQSVAYYELPDETKLSFPEPDPSQNVVSRPTLGEPKATTTTAGEGGKTEEETRNAARTKAIIIIATAVLAVVAVGFVLSIPKKIK